MKINFCRTPRRANTGLPTLDDYCEQCHATHVIEEKFVNNDYTNAATALLTELKRIGITADEFKLSSELDTGDLLFLAGQLDNFVSSIIQPSLRCPACTRNDKLIMNVTIGIDVSMDDEGDVVTNAGAFPDFDYGNDNFVSCSCGWEGTLARVLPQTVTVKGV